MYLLEEIHMFMKIVNINTNSSKNAQKFYTRSIIF